MKQAHYIITGAGASGLMLAYRMACDSFFDDKSIIIIDSDNQKQNDRTWCYWETGAGEWDELLSKQWHHIYFGSKTHKKKYDISPYSYKLIRSQAFYDHLWRVINTKSNFEFICDKIIDIKEKEAKVLLQGKDHNYQCAKLFNSISNPKLYINQQQYPVLQQHFVGWFIKTKHHTFDDSFATFMDFDIPQKGHTRFMYILPLDQHTALFEYTLFSKDLLNFTEYEKAIKDYLAEKGIKNYDIIEKEKGAIPMTSYNFSKHNSQHILNIGTAGGWTKASTGYTFKNSTKKTKALVNYLKTSQDLRHFSKKNKFWYYDLLLLDVLSNHNAKGSALFSSMFKKTNVKTILRFLDEESTLLEDLKIITAVPPKNFIKAFIKRLFY